MRGLAGRDAGGEGSALQVRVVAQQLARNHLAGHALDGQLRRHGEGLDHESLGMGRFPHHQRHRAPEGDPNKQRCEAQRDAYPGCPP
jgi:hypothetical protein